MRLEIEAAPKLSRVEEGQSGMHDLEEDFNEVKGKSRKKNQSSQLKFENNASPWIRQREINADRFGPKTPCMYQIKRYSLGSEIIFFQSTC